MWLYLLDHWDDGSTELWYGENIVSESKAREFLTQNESSTLKNGFVDIVTHSIEGETNLKLSEHKTIQLNTKSEVVFKNFIGAFIDLGFSQTRDFHSIEYGFHHWHYRPLDSLDKPQLANQLRKQGFKNVEEQKSLQHNV